MTSTVSTTNASERGGILRQLSGSTPDRLRLGAVVISIIAVAVGLAVWLAADRLVSDTNTIADSTGEVLITAQQVNASLVEADAAARAVHLAGADGDPGQQRLYEDAIERASVGLERIAAVVGGDSLSHELIAESNAQIAQFSRMVESARNASVDGDANAAVLIGDASALMNESILPNLTSVTERAADRYADESSSAWFIAFVAALLVVAVLLVVAQLLLARRFRRIINIPLLLATVIGILLAVFVGSAYVSQQSALDNANVLAYSSIEASDSLQRNAFEYQAALLAGTDAAGLAEIEDRVQAELARSAAIADGQREKAAAEAVRVRWQRFVDEGARLQAAGSTQAVELARGPFTSAFNGFNTTVEAALLSNREQFETNVDVAADSLRWMRALTAIGAALIALLTWWGFSLRIGEYR